MLRARNKIRRKISEEQYGFMQDKGTRNAIYILRILAERAIEMQEDAYLCFIDYSKAFDKVKHKEHRWKEHDRVRHRWKGLTFD